ncbi:ketoacyl-ACP synthase III family protein [Cryobacterium sp. M15]|jgi:3-oxoacyl-[acyl-carrier-protein] synthase-3|uniref:ketoacyl-ACP synthase III family protein n=1 Tax=Cryobacterium sp. M15 TaxID=2048291 RepID=UPI000CE46890|nr:ketoacyl-ACP synthase III family protein [Cryobacterium sp. M15]
MRWTDLYIGGIGSYLPTTFETAEHAISEGRLTQTELVKSAQISATKGGSHETAPDMAVWAGQQALHELQAYGSPTGDPELIVHAVALHTGLEAWNGAAYIGNGVGHPSTLAIEIRNTCAGSIVGIELLARYLSPNGVGLLTAADIWRLPMFDRWGTDSGLAYGDAGAALALSRTTGPFQILSTAVIQNSRFEQMHRGNASIDQPEYRGSLPFSMRKRSADYARSNGLDDFWQANTEGLRQAVDQAINDAGISRHEIRAWSLPHFGKTLLRRQCLEPLGLDPAATTSDFGARVGHTGAADPLLGLDYLRSESRIRTGDYIAMIGIGAGFTWGCAIVRYDEPEN